MELANLTAQFAEAVEAQEREIAHGDSKQGNEFAKKYIRAAHQLLKQGGPGIDAFAALLRHAQASVRVQAAYYLLPFRTEESLSVLETTARSKGVAALAAIMTLARWKGGEKEVWEQIERLSESAKLSKPRRRFGRF